MNPNWLWLLWWAGWGFVEAWAIWVRKDALQPNTFWIRKLPWVVRAGIILWLAQHFLLCGTAC
jgi:hypothetical protein